MSIPPDARGRRLPYGRRHTIPTAEEYDMPKYVIERDLPGAGALTPAELHTIAVKSNQVVENMGPRIQWMHSYVTDDKLYCVYIAEDEEAIYDHGRCGGFPVSAVSQVRAMFDPTTGE